MLLTLLAVGLSTQAQTRDSLRQGLGAGLQPSAISTVVEYDAATNSYVRITKLGDRVIARTIMTFDEYQRWRNEQVQTAYWKEKNQTSEGGGDANGILNNLPGLNEMNSKLESLLGSRPNISITPSGSADLTFQVVNNRRENPSLDVTKRSVTTFDFDENIQLNLNAKIGDLINFDIKWNTQATFDFENQIKLRYEGKEDDIIQLIEAGDISYPLNTHLIKGSQQLFGFHTKLKFGKLTVDAVFSQKETSTENLQVKGGASSHEFEIRADEYEDNRHFFLAQYFYDNYNRALSTLPVVNSNIRILRIEVWRTNVGAAVTNNRNLLALTDIGENVPSNSRVTGGHSVMPRNNSNNILQMFNLDALRSINNVTSYMQSMGMESGVDYEKIESARLLNSNEYTFNRQLGFISLHQPLSNDQVLAVAFQYQVVGDTTIYQVGEMTTDGVNDPNTLVVKLLKSTTINTRAPIWKLMMKNVYFLKSTQLSRDNFRLNVLYENTEGGVGIGYFTEGPKEGVPLVEVFGLDRMDATQNYYYADGVMDWFDSAAYKGGIIQSSSGRIYFPYVEPFGKDLREILGGGDIADRYCYDSLYTMTQTLARQYADKNKFYLEGYYTSSVSGEISLGYSVTQGSVSVTAGGVPLIENVDYTVDYTMGVVRIINESILSSGTPISVSSENNSFSMTTKRMLGVHLDYELEKDFNIGATFMNLHEKPLTMKNNFGEEPTSNSIWGLDVNYRHEAPLITRLVDKLPGINTKAPSTLNLTAEFAQFIPGMSRTGSSEGSVSYIDDFEGAEAGIDLKNVGAWHLASTPQDWNSNQPLFPESAPNTGRAYGFNRARLAWYRIDDLFYSSNSPSNINADDRSQPYARRIAEQEVFPNKDLAAGQVTHIYELNLAYYPDEKGPYNYDVGGSLYSAGIDANGRLNNPASRWGGIMRAMDYTDFETQNIETIEFWIMDPFIDNPNHSGGKLYINLGDISEDILRDGKKSFENGITVDGTALDTTIWGVVPTTQPIVNAFDNDAATRKFQDVGYDGLSSTHDMDDEQRFNQAYLDEIAAVYGTNSQAYLQAATDPSSDDFRFFRSSYYDQNNTKINDRYKYYNNPEGNSPVDDDNSESYATAATTLPNVEDINRDNTLSEAENYYQYVVALDPNHMNIGENYIVDIQEAQNVQLANGEYTTCKWYQFRIPIREPQQKIGNINGFQSIRFMRMFLNDFEEPVILRFATLELVYSTWRKYSESLLQPGDYSPSSNNETSFSISTVNIEENGSREPVPYVLPRGIQREEWYSSSSTATQLNEQSLSMSISNLEQGDARAIYRNVKYDLRYYGKMRMFVHAEKMNATDLMNDDDLTLFVRIGNDYTSNYYEYEVPLKLTPWGVSRDQADIIWPDANKVDIDLDHMVDIKTRRNKLIRHGETQYSRLIAYSEEVNGHTYSVLGSPNLGKVKVIMIGVRNPRKERLDDGNDMLPKSVIVWVNELRLADYNNRGGWSAMLLARTNLADIGNASIYGAYTSAGFGNLEDNLVGLELVNHFNIQTTLDLELGRFLPQKWGLHIPFYIDHSREIGSPEYNPLDPDVLLRDDLRTYATSAERDSVKEMVQQRKKATNITFTNVRKDRTGEKALKPHFYDVENLSFSYAFSHEHQSDDETQSYDKKMHRGTINYNYNIAQPKQFTPFSRAKLLQDKRLRLIKDFNLYYQPRSVSFSTEIMRDFEETILRNKGEALVIIRPTYFKQFTWSRTYGLQYDISRSLHLQYNANAQANIEEPVGRVDTRGARDTIWHSLLGGGDIKDFNQSIALNWDAPIGKLPYLDFVKMPLTYRTNYHFEGSTVATRSMGNTLESSTTLQASSMINLQTLYNRSALLKKAFVDNRGKKRNANKRNNVEAPKRTFESKRDSIAYRDSLRREEREERLRELGYFGLRMLTGVKNINIQYNQTFGNYLPGFMGKATLVGLDPSHGWSPGVGYILGFTDGAVERLRRDDLLSRDSLMNAPHRNTYSRTLSLQATVEPVRDLKIDLTCTQNYSSREEYYYKYLSQWDRVDGPLQSITTGNYTTTIWTFRTAFRNRNDLFQDFLDNRSVIADRLAAMNDDPYNDQMLYDSVSGTYYPAGYSGNSQTVLLTSFLATYTGKSAHDYGFSPFLKLPLPNWNINYTGLNKIPLLKKWFTNITLSHKYASTYSIGNYYTDAVLSDIDDYDYGSETLVNGSGDYVPPVSMEAVQISEQFNPLIRVAVSLVNSLQFNFSLQKNRTLALSFSNNQLTETSRNGITFGAGYRFKDVELHIKSGGRTRDFKSDVVLQLNVTYNSNKTEIRKINQNLSQISAGSKVWMVELSGEYALSTTLTVRLFFQTNINTPYISNSYPNSTTKGGLTIRFNF